MLVYYFIYVFVQTYEIKLETGKLNGSYLFTSLFNYLIFLAIGKYLTNIFNNMIQNLNENTKFKAIFENLDESIIIIKCNDHTIEYANDKFVHEFENEINQVANDENDISEPHILASCIR